jgi:hypothetical protein
MDSLQSRLEVGVGADRRRLLTSVASINEPNSELDVNLVLIWSV